MFFFFELLFFFYTCSPMSQLYNNTKKVAATLRVSNKNEKKTTISPPKNRKNSHILPCKNPQRIYASVKNGLFGIFVEHYHNLYSWGSYDIFWRFSQSEFTKEAKNGIFELFVKKTHTFDFTRYCSIDTCYIWYHSMDNLIFYTNKPQKTNFQERTLKNC